MNRSKPIARRVRPKRNTRVKRRNVKRWTKNHARAYGGKDRTEWVKTLPCAACLIVGYSENAHVGRKGRGAGRKADADQVIPLCGIRPHHKYEDTLWPGCHHMYDEARDILLQEFGFSEAHALNNAALTQRAWLAYAGLDGDEA